MLDFPTRTIQTQSAPENAGTKQLARGHAVVRKFLSNKTPTVLTLRLVSPARLHGFTFGVASFGHRVKLLDAIAALESDAGAKAPSLAVASPASSTAPPTVASVAEAV